MNDSIELVPLNALDRSVENMRDETLIAITSVIDSGWFINGPNNKAFESELGTYLGSKHVIGCANGTDALQLALAALGLGHGDSVITAANAGGYASTAIDLVGAIPVYADVDINTHLLSVTTLAEALKKRTPRPKALIVTHLYGAAAPITEICDWAAQEGISVVEDCAQALGASVEGGRVGTFADIGTTSFYPTKNLGALGDGGAIFTSNARLASRIRSLSQYGWGQKYHTSISGGSNSRLDELQAAVLRIRLPGLDELNSKRKAIHSRYQNASPSHVKFVNSSNDSFVAHLAVLEVAQRDAAVEYFNSLGIATDVHYPVPDHMQENRQDTNWRLPATEFLADRILSVPLFPELTEIEIARVEAALANVPSFTD